MILIDGKKVAAELRVELKQEVSELKAKYNKVPGLTVILIGDMAPSQIYVRMKEKAANEVGLKSEVIRYSEEVEEKTSLKLTSLPYLWIQICIRTIAGLQAFFYHVGTVVRIHPTITKFNTHIITHPLGGKNS